MAVEETEHDEVEESNDGKAKGKGKGTDKGKVKGSTVKGQGKGEDEGKGKSTIKGKGTVKGTHAGKGYGEASGLEDTGPANRQLNHMSPVCAQVARVTGLDAAAQRVQTTSFRSAS